MCPQKSDDGFTLAYTRAGLRFTSRDCSNGVGWQNTAVCRYRCARGGMADAPDLGSGPERGGGSSPLARTIPARAKNSKLLGQGAQAEAVKHWPSIPLHKPGLRFSM